MPRGKIIWEVLRQRFANMSQPRLCCPASWKCQLRPGFFWQVACTCWAFYPAVVWLGRGHSLCFRAEHHLIRNRYQIMIVVFMLWGPYLFATTIPPSFSVHVASRNSKRTFGLGRFSSASHPTPNFQLSPNETGSLMNSLIKCNKHQLWTH